MSLFMFALWGFLTVGLSFIFVGGLFGAAVYVYVGVGFGGLAGVVGLIYIMLDWFKQVRK